MFARKILIAWSLVMVLAKIHTQIFIGPKDWREAVCKICQFHQLLVNVIFFSLYLVQILHASFVFVMCEAFSFESLFVSRKR